jgi:hypothetical protein
MAALGHEDQFRSPTLSVRRAFGHPIFARTHRKGRDAPQTVRSIRTDRRANGKNTKYPGKTNGLPRDVAWQARTVRTAIWKEPVQGRRMARRLIDCDG